MAIRTDIDTPTPMSVAPMRRYGLLLGAALSGSAVVYHFVSGNTEVMVPLYAADLPPEVTAVLDIVWYDIALLAAIGAIGMLVAAYRPAWRMPLAWFIGGHYLALALLCLGFSFAWFGNPWDLIQWVIFGPIALITIWAARG